MTETQSPKPDLSTGLAVERTRVAYDRTMMAWIRTAFSLITFGFTIYKYFQIQRTAPPSERLIGPREFAIILISLGLFTLAVAVWQNRQNILKLREYYPETPGSFAGLLAGLVAILGFLALLSVLLRL